MTHSWVRHESVQIQWLMARGRYSIEELGDNTDLGHVELRMQGAIQAAVRLAWPDNRPYASPIEAADLVNGLHSRHPDTVDRAVFHRERSNHAMITEVLDVHDDDPDVDRGVLVARISKVSPRSGYGSFIVAP